MFLALLSWRCSRISRDQHSGQMPRGHLSWTSTTIYITHIITWNRMRVPISSWSKNDMVINLQQEHLIWQWDLKAGCHRQWRLQGAMGATPGCPLGSPGAPSRSTRIGHHFEELWRPHFCPSGGGEGVLFPRSPGLPSKVLLGHYPEFSKGSILRSEGAPSQASETPSWDSGDTITKYVGIILRSEGAPSWRLWVHHLEFSVSTILQMFKIK